MSRRSPYKGLEAFTEDDHDIFHGRKDQIQQVVRYLTAFRLSILYGESGVGKSSLLRAGVVPAVREAAQRRIRKGQPPGQAIVVFPPPEISVAEVWDDAPERRLLAQVEKVVGGLLASPPAPPKDPGLAEQLRHWAGVLGWGDARPGRVLLVLDQFEDCIPDSLDEPESPRILFIQSLAEVINSFGLPVNVLLSVRQSAFTRLDRLKPYLQGLMDKRIELRAMDRASAQQAITEPLRVLAQVDTAEPCQVQSELIEEVLAIVRSDNADEYQAPYLQLIMKTLWDRVRDEHRRQILLDDLIAFSPGSDATPRRAARQIVSDHFRTQLRNVDRNLASGLLECLVSRSGVLIPQKREDLVDAVTRNPVFPAPGPPEADVRELLRRWSHEFSRLLRVREGNHYEIYFSMLAQVIREWLDTCIRLDLLARHARESEERFRSSQLSALRDLHAATAALLAIHDQDTSNCWLSDPSAIDVVRILQIVLEKVREIWRYPADEAIPTTLYGLSLSPRGSWIATGSFDGNVRIWDIDPQPPRPLVSFFSAASLTYLAFSPDGRRLVTLSAPGRVRVWRLEEERSRPGSLRAVAEAAFDTGDGLLAVCLGIEAEQPLVATASFRGEVAVHAPAAQGQGYEVRARCEPFQRASLNFVRRLAFEPGGRLLEIGGTQGTHVLWEWQSQRKWRFGRSGAEAPSTDVPVLCGSSSQRVAVTMDGEAWVLDIAHPQRAVTRCCQLHSSQAVEALLEDQALHVVHADGVLRCWRQEGDVNRITEIHLNQTPMFRAFIRDTGQGGRLVTLSANGRVHLWDTSADLSRQLPGDVLQIAATGKNWMTCVDVSRDGERLACLSFRGQSLTVMDFPPPQDPGQAGPGSKQEAPIDEVTRAKFLPSGNMIALAGVLPDADHRSGCGVAIIHAGSLELLARCQRHDDVIYSLDVHPSEPLLAAASADGTFSLWDHRNARLVYRSPLLNEGGLFAVAFSPDGAHLSVATTSGKVLIYNIHTPEHPHPAVECLGHQSVVFGLAWLPGGTQIASASADATVGIWTTEGTRKHHLNHSSIVYGLGFSPDGTILAAGEANGTVTLWGRQPGEWRKIREYHHHIQPVFNVCFHPSAVQGNDQHRLITASADGTVKIRRLESPQQLLERAAGTLTRAGCGVSSASG